MLDGNSRRSEDVGENDTVGDKKLPLPAQEGSGEEIKSRPTKMASTDSVFMTVEYLQ